MRSLFRIIKQKCRRANTKRSSDSGSLERSPFAGGECDIEYPDTVALQTAPKHNPLAELAQKMSTSSEYKVTSAAEFLAESTSVDLEKPEDCLYNRTSWPFSSFAQNDFPEMQLKEDKKDISKPHGFEFNLPRRVSSEEVEQSVYTLTHWGSIESKKFEDTETDYNNSTDNHFHTWKNGTTTPFDHASPQSPFREDSANQENITSLVESLKDNEVVTLPLLEKTINRLKTGSVLDLGGSHLSLEGNLVVANSDITIQNGTLELLHGMCIGGRRVILQDLTIICRSSKAAALRVTRKGCCVTRCKVTNSSGVGIQVTGLGTCVTLRQSRVYDCERSCVCVSRAAILKIEESVITGSKSFHGISATDSGTELWIEDSKIGNHFQDGAYITNNAHAVIEHCEVFNSHAFHGIAVKKFGTSAVLKNCYLHGFKESGLVVEMGAKVKMTDCSVKKCQKSQGIVIDGHGSHIEAVNCEVGDCDVGGILVQGNASSKIVKTHIFGSRYGNGIVIAEEGSYAHVLNSVIFQNCRNGVMVMYGAAATLEDCDVLSSTAASGVFVRGSDSKATLLSCRLSNNFASNVCADARGFIFVKSCTFDSARQGPSLMSRGRKTMISVEVPERDVKILESDLYSLRLGKIIMNEKKRKNKERWPKLKTGQIFFYEMPKGI